MLGTVGPGCVGAVEKCMVLVESCVVSVENYVLRGECGELRGGCGELRGECGDCQVLLCGKAGITQSSFIYFGHGGLLEC